MTKKRPLGPVLLLSLFASVRGLTMPKVNSCTFLRGKQGGRVSSSSLRMSCVGEGMTMAPVRNDVAVGRIAWGRHVKKKWVRGLSNANGAASIK